MTDAKGYDTSRDLEAVERICEEATPGPWHYVITPEYDSNEGVGCIDICREGAPYWIVEGCHDAETGECHIPTAAFIAAARTALPDALARLRALRAGLDLHCMLAELLHAYEQREPQYRVEYQRQMIHDVARAIGVRDPEKWLRGEGCKDAE